MKWNIPLSLSNGSTTASAGNAAVADLASGNYNGPADGDFARYVDQLMDRAQAQRLIQVQAAAPAEGRKARRPPARQETTAAVAREREKTAPKQKKTATGFAWPKLLSFGWIIVALAISFWGQAIFWLLVALVVGAVLWKFVARGNSDKTS